MRKKTIILISVVILIGGCAGAFFWFDSLFSGIGGPIYDLNNKQDVQKLLSIADGGRSFREALERFKHDHGSYPNDITNLIPAYLQGELTPAPASCWAGWYYFQESTNGYMIFYKLNWDDDLLYEHMVHGSNRWCIVFDGETQTDLTLKFQQR